MKTVTIQKVVYTKGERIDIQTKEFGTLTFRRFEDIESYIKRNKEPEILRNVFSQLIQNESVLINPEQIEGWIFTKNDAARVQ